MSLISDDAALAGKISAYLSQQTGGPIGVASIRRFPAGFSWLTFLVPVTGLPGHAGTHDHAS